MVSLQEQIQGQGKKCVVLLLLAVGGHQQQKQYHKQIFCLKVFGQKLPQKTADAAGLSSARFPGLCQPPGWRIVHTIAAG